MQKYSSYKIVKLHALAMKYEMFYMLFYLHYNIWFCKAEIRPFIALYNTIVPDSDFNKSQTTFQAWLSFSEELF